LFATAEEPWGADEHKESADAAGLRYVSDAAPGIRRRRAGRAFAYLRPDGSRLAEPRVLGRIRSLAIPPAWTDVWICPYADGHIQATGRDARGRKQYRYHALFREAREHTKYDHVIEFADALPAIRRRVDAHLALRGLPREKVLATVVQLLETTLVRVGNDDYARHNDSYGLTTLKSRHVAIEGSQMRFRFTGKGGKQWMLKVNDRRIAKIVRACQELPGQELLQYLDENGKPQDVTSGDVNAYLREISGQDITAKDFRTWAGTVLAALELSEIGGFTSSAQAKRNLKTAMERVASRLGNTATICRKCYVHPEALKCYLEGGLALEIQVAADLASRLDRSGLQPQEAAVLALLRARLPRAPPQSEPEPIDRAKSSGRASARAPQWRGKPAGERE
jgi:DNA topoisomerase-1